MGCPTACRCGPYSKPPRPGVRRPTPMDGRPAAEGVDGVDIAQGRRAWRQIILMNGAIHLPLPVHRLPRGKAGLRTRTSPRGPAMSMRASPALRAGGCIWSIRTQARRPAKAANSTQGRQAAGIRRRSLRLYAPSRRRRVPPASASLWAARNCRARWAFCPPKRQMRPRH